MNEDRADEERVVVLGRIGSPFGVAGWVNVQSYTDPPEGLLNYRTWLIQRGGQWSSMRPLHGRKHGASLIAQLEGVESRETAAELRNIEVGVRRSELPKLEQGDVYWDDLIGLRAETPAGDSMGEIAEIRMTPAHPVLRILERSVTHGRAVERWVPLVKERIKAVDLDARRVVLDWQRDW